ncbi:MAG: hypothetical protein U0610_19465 [bacterium]
MATRTERRSAAAPPRSPRPQSPELCVGYARIDITPPVGTPLAGETDRKGRLAQRVRDPLHARALHIQAGERAATLVIADLLVVPAALHQAVARAAEVEPSALLLAATHSHSATGGYWNGGPLVRYFMGPYQESIFRELVARLAQVARESRARATPARLLGARVALTGVNANRRRLLGPIDPDLTLVRFEREHHRPIDVVSFSAHPVIGSERDRHAISADFPGELCRRIEARGRRAMFFQGAVGGLSPLFPEFPQPIDVHLSLVGSLLEDGVDRAETALAPLSHEPFETRLARVPLPPPTCRVFPATMRHGWLAEAATFPLRRWIAAQARHARHGDPDAPLHLVRLGDSAWLGTPCDLGVNVALALKQTLVERGVRFPMIGSQCDGYVGYVHMPDDYQHVPEPGFRELGFYENAMSLSGWNLGADFVATLRSW